MSPKNLYILSSVSSEDNSRKELFGNIKVEFINDKQHSQRLVNDLEMVSFHVILHKEINSLRDLLMKDLIDRQMLL